MLHDIETMRSYFISLRSLIRQKLLCFLCGVRWFTLCCFHADKIQNPEMQFPKPCFAIPVPSWSAPSLDLEHSPKPSFAIPVPCGVIWVGKVTLVFLLYSLCGFIWENFNSKSVQMQDYFCGLDTPELLIQAQVNACFLSKPK